jgi:hypothetical protein
MYGGNGSDLTIFTRPSGRTVSSRIALISASVLRPCWAVRTDLIALNDVNCPTMTANRVDAYPAVTPVGRRRGVVVLTGRAA